MARKSLRERGRALGRTVAAGIKGTLISGGTGGGVYFAHRVASENLEVLQTRTWLAPVAMIALGHAMKMRRGLNVPGIATCGAGGYALAQAIDFQMKINAAKKEGASETKGLVSQLDTGAVISPGDVGNQLDEGSFYDVPSYMPSEAHAL